MKKEELKEKMEKAKGWVIKYKKRIAGAAAAVILVAVCAVSGVALSTQADGDADAGTKTVEARIDQDKKKTAETQKGAAVALKKAETEEKDSAKEKTEEKKKADDKKEAAKDTSDTKQAQKTASAASQKSSSSSKESGSSGSGNASPSSSSGNSNSSQESKPAAQQPATSAPAEQKPAEPEQPAHVHNWEQQYKTEKTWVDTSWDEEVSEPIYETVEKSICNTCGADISGFAESHILEGNCEGYHSEWVEVQTGTNTYTVHHEDGHWEEHQVPAGYKCSGCGATK